MIACAHCGTKVHAEAAGCPKCGADPRTGVVPQSVRRLEAGIPFDAEAPSLGARLPFRGLGIASVVLCVFAVLAAAAVGLLIALSLAYAYEGVDFDDPVFSGQVNRIFVFVFIGGFLAAIAAALIYTRPRAGASLALGGAVLGASAFVVSPDVLSHAAIVLWLPDVLLLSSAAIVAAVRYGHIRVLHSHA